ncbi:MAG: Gp138 family membrane-puncturing spike protein [Plesiomonas sp.]
MGTLITSHNLYRVAFRELAKEVYTCIPGYLLAYDPATQRAQVQIGVQRVDINGSAFTPPVIVDVPVSIYGSDSHFVEVEFQPGCEGMIHFSQRCIDGWKQTGKVGVNPIARFHHAKDATFIPGVRSLAGKITGYANNGVRLRNKSGDSYVWLKRDGTVEQRNPKGFGTLSPDGTMNINGVTISPSGLITVPSSGGIIDAKGINVETHKHGGVQGGNSDTGVPK